MFASMTGATQHSEIFIAEGEDMAKEELKQFLEKASSLFMVTFQNSFLLFHIQ